MAKVLNVYKKGNETAIATGDANSVAITGLAAGTVVATGDYQVAFVDGYQTSDKVDVPGFTVLIPKPANPQDVKATPTTNGANVTAR
ncbi:hypothetical protein [Furfurilactobacillus milii]|uniref:Uncharacterized protein n=1 Tax=Furfurilactobacillus milii TaxID=2888272 RepID=A0ABT6DHP9_9LACO|nr:hypothetical protein [Furfurilactobacillus milii]QLE67421.1 hypothetical protein LROSL2_2071 [Furfurilactobacillus rossiae]MCF6161901.1 hypothetical protein [Furfurilactobacillus milii]MCF6164281.1 hypothetical protein [Furfurilactobacillus milii]MDF9914906.1 hypothetical protein [Furfurilactobacillus milii]QLE69850.1 hypothetical protein LROSL3_2129 [Furfurilactobacillus rossiae]